jgi:hypothetical protein
MAIPYDNSAIPRKSRPGGDFASHQMNSGQRLRAYYSDMKDLPKIVGFL